MPVNLPPKVRAAIYVVVVLGSAIIVPLNAANIINDVVLSVWTSLSAAASAMAALNVSSSK